MTSPSALQYDQFYHIYNRGNNREVIFCEERNYRYFMELYAYHVGPVADTYAYCLLSNHFHFLVRIKREEEIQTFRVSETRKVSTPSWHFGSLFNAYTKAINKAYARSGSLFQKPFGRVLIQSNAHLVHLVRYIHQNPQAHGFVPDFRQWHYSSYHALVSDIPTHLARADVHQWFGDRQEFIAAQSGELELRPIAYLVGE